MDTNAIIQSLYASAAEIILVIAACVLLLLGVFDRLSQKTIAYLAILSIIGAALACHLISPANAWGYNRMFVLDDFSLFFKNLFFIVSIGVILSSIQFLKLKQLQEAEYYVFLLFSLCGMLLMVSGADLITIYVGIELVALSGYILCGFSRKELHSTEAALKYAILGALSSAILLYGISLFYGLTGTTQLQQITLALAEVAPANPGLLLAVTFVIAGFAFKVAAVPFHMWLPDVYQGAPTPITAFMAIGPKIAAFAVLARVLHQALAGQQELWTLLLTLLAVLTLITGSYIALVQTNIKRLLAYSGIAHAGFLLLGLLTATQEGLAATMFYLFVYAFMSLGAFAVIITLFSPQHPREQLNDYRGLVQQHPWLSLAMTIFMFSLAGIPPTAGFFAKFNIIMALIHQHHQLLALLAVIFSVISAFYYLRIIMLIMMKPPDSTFNLTIAWPLTLVIFGTAAVTLVLGLWPTPLLTILEGAGL